jgi:hypothetical protein
MKIFSILTLVLATMTASIHGLEKEMIISTKVLSPSEINHSNSNILKEEATDNYATILTFDKLPEESIIKMKIERPILREIPSEKNKKYHEVIELTREELLISSQNLKMDKPCMTFTSSGFLPGEEVKIFLECKGYKSKPITHIPHPVKLSSKVDGAHIKVRLSSLSMSNYYFNLVNFKPGEKVKYNSNNCGEVLSGVLDVKENMTFSLACGVKGFTGGLDKVKFIRSNGEVIEVTLPWGDELVEHLYGQKNAVIAN